ncbi:MAG: phosphopantetheine-binding protein [Burkholderiaceae bacterium]
MDSLAIAEFMFAVEDHFHITLPDDDPNITTLEQLAALVDRTLLAKAAVPVASASRKTPFVTEAK